LSHPVAEERNVRKTCRTISGRAPDFCAWPARRNCRLPHRERIGQLPVRGPRLRPSRAQPSFVTPEFEPCANSLLIAPGDIDKRASLLPPQQPVNCHSALPPWPCGERFSQITLRRQPRRRPIAPGHNLRPIQPVFARCPITKKVCFPG